MSIAASRVGEQCTEVQRALDRVLAALVATDALGLLTASLTHRGADHVEVLTKVQLDTQFIPHRPCLG